MSGFYKILANKALDESLMIALKFRDFLVAGVGGVLIFYMANFANKLKLNNFFINTLGGFLVTIFSSFATKLGKIGSYLFAGRFSPYTAG